MPAALALGALAIAVTAPSWTLLWAPLLLGVPHMLGDLRALVLEAPQRVPTWLRVTLVVVGVATMGARIGPELTWWTRWAPMSALELSIGLGGVLFAAVMARRPFAGAVAAALALGAAWIGPALALLAFSHIHNVVALVAAALRQGRRAAPLVLVTGAGTLAIATLPLPAPWWSAPFDLGALGRQLAPGASPEVATRVLVAYAFLQLVHYVVWVVALPDRRPWRTILGTAWWPAAVACVALPALAWSDPATVRATYLSAALFHGWCELVALAGRR